MLIIIQILILAALIGGSLSFFLGRRTKDDAMTGAAGGILVAAAFMVRVLSFGIMALFGIWFLSKII
jgi:hypothetical protein